MRQFAIACLALLMVCTEYDPATKFIVNKLHEFDRATVASAIPQVIKAKSVCAANKGAQREMADAILARAGLGYRVTRNDMTKNCPIEESTDDAGEPQAPLSNACQSAKRSTREAYAHLNAVGTEEEAKYRLRVTANFQEQLGDRFIVEIAGGISFPGLPAGSPQAQAAPTPAPGKP